MAQREREWEREREQLGAAKAELERIRTALRDADPAFKAKHEAPLGRRAYPFAVFIAHAHRKLHALWGAKYIEELKKRPASDPLNDCKLEVTVEFVVEADGSLDRTKIILPSGRTPFDVAALEAVSAAAPFDPTPDEIRSSDGLVYLAWVLHRDDQQCSPYNAIPFILDGPP